MELKEKIEIATRKMSEKNKAQIDKFSYALINGESENFKLLEEHDIYPTSPSSFIIYTIIPRELKHYVELTEQMNFIEDMRHKPRRLTNPQTAEIIRRMAECDAMHIPYRDPETNLCADFIFDEEEYNRTVKPLIEEAKQKEPVEENKSSETSFMNFDTNTNDDALLEKKNHIKQHCDKLLETFTLTAPEDKEAINRALDKVDISALSEKEILLATFNEAFQVGNVELLSSEIDKVLEIDETLNDDIGRMRGAA